MRIINPSFEIINRPNGHEVLRHLELCGRVCYKSEDAISDESAERLIRMMLERGHESPIEHFGVQNCQVVSRGDQQVGGVDASDHRPVIADIRFQTEEDISGEDGGGEE